MNKRFFVNLLLLFTVLFVLSACSESNSGNNSEKAIEKEVVVQTFLMYNETSETEDDGSIGDLYMKTISSESEKIASNVVNEQYKYIQSNDTVLFLTSDLDLYEYKRGLDKEKIASDVQSFEGGYDNNVIFYQNEDSDLYIINKDRESEKIASSTYQMDMIDSDLYYVNGDNNLFKYNVETRQEIMLSSNVTYFELLNKDGDYMYVNDDSMLFYKQYNQDEAIKISSKEVNPYQIRQVSKGFIYVAFEDGEQVLYQTSLDGSDTIKIATDVNTYEIKGDTIVYLTYDDNVFAKKVQDDAALKLASDVFYFSVSDEIVYYEDMDNNLFAVTDEGEKTKKASDVETFRITESNELIYNNSNHELFLNDTKLATDLDDYALFANNLAYATDDNKLYFMDNLGEAIVVEEDLSKYSVVTYQNNTIFSNYLSFADLVGDWKMTVDGKTGVAHISVDGVLSNDLYGTTIKLEFLSSGYNYINVNYDDEYARLEYSGDTMVLKDDYYEIYFERIKKSTKAETKENEEVKTEEPKSEEVPKEKQPTQIDLDTVPVPGANNTVESTRDQISYVVYYYLETYVNLDTDSLADYVHPSSAFYSEQKKYMDTLVSRGVELSIADHTITAIDQLAPNKYKVTVKEDYEMYDPEKGYSEPSQTSKYTIELMDGWFVITAFSF